jgi:MATE family multidrug resistance protein
VIGLALKVPLNYVFISDWGPVPAMGGVGAAVATACCETALLVVLLAQTWRIFRDVWPRGGGLLDLAAFRRLASSGLALGLQMGTELWAFGAIAVMAGWLGETALAAHTAVINLASVVFMFPLGISTAAATRVGNLLGESRPWQQAARAAYLLGGGVAALVVALFLLLPEQLVQLYQVTAEVRPMAVALVFVAACMHFLDATQVITFGVLRGAGDVRVPTLANVAGYYAIGLPVAWLLGLHRAEGPAGLWWGLVAGQVGVVALLLWRLRHTARHGGYRMA